MFNKTRLLLSSLLFCTALVACSDNDNQLDETVNTETTEQQVDTNTSPSTTKIEAGMTEQAVTDLLGAPTYVQTHTLDSLTITHSEWIDKAGITSVQFQNGIVQFNQYTPASK